MMIRICALLLVVGGWTRVAAGAQADLAGTFGVDIPDASTVFVERTATRMTVCLNGKWSFRPAADDAAPPASGEWARISVPGIWNKPWETMARTEDGSPLDGIDLGKLTAAWFQRQVVIPAEAANRRVSLDFRDISGSGKVFINGTEAGAVAGWGMVDVTKLVEPGQACTLSVLVAATSPKAGKPTVFGGPVVSDRPLGDRGILGDVFLRAVPSGAIIRHTAIRTSTADASWHTVTELEGLKAGARYRLLVEALDAEGKAASRMEATIAADGAIAEVPAAAAWSDAHRWELNDPYLYTCLVRLSDERGNLVDESRESFGFREFSIAKENFVFNGRNLRLRPQIVQGNWQHIPTFCPALIRAQLSGIKADGFNIVEHWPSRFYAEAEHIAAEADRLGILLILPLESMIELADRFREQRRVDPEWREEVRRQVALLGNHPSVVMWAVSPNVFGTARPPFFVRNGPLEYSYLASSREGARVALAAYKELDPTRPVLFHASDVGDLSAPNLYLNMMPLQEQRDFLDLWASEKAFPLMMIECGIPISEALLRFRRPGFDAWLSAPFATEAAAIYLGDEAYALERDEYLRRIEGRFVGNEAYRTWQYPDAPNQEENFNRVSALFVRERWRAWRAWGITGGMLPWEYEDLSYVKGRDQFRPVDDTEVEIGARSAPGCWPDRAFRGSLVPWTVAKDPRAAVKFARAWRPVGLAFQDVNQPVLAFIGGPGGKHTDQTHNYYGGGTLARDIIAVYDGDDATGTRTHLRWRVKLGSDTLQSAEQAVSLESAGDRRLPIRLRLPEVQRRTEGEITLQADGRQVDRYSFTVFPRLAVRKLKRPVVALDPVGLTTKMLKSFGVACRSASGEPGPGGMLVIGREALSGNAGLDFDLAAAVEKGLNVVMFAQSPDFWEERMGWRTSWHVSRSFWISRGAESALAPLKDRDLSDWADSGTLLPRRYEYPKEVVDDYPPPQPIWHSGNRGSVASVALEKPHYGGFTPLVEGEYDLAYSPLLELRYGKGVAYIVQLDLEDSYGSDPTADYVLDAILRLADSSPAEDAPPLMVWGDNPAECLAHLERGGNVLVAASDEATVESAAQALGVELEVKTARLHGGGFELPKWPELRGVSASDLHWRGNLDVPVVSEIAGGEIAANGLLAKRRIGRGAVVFCLATPAAFPVPAMRERRQRPDEMERAWKPGEKTYFRISRWRTERLVSQVKTNLGAGQTDQDRLFLTRLASPPAKAEMLDLSGPGWSARHDDRGSGESDGWFGPGVDESGWTPAVAPVHWEEGAPWVQSGACWFRKRFALPASMRGKRVAVRLTAADAGMFVYLNGRELVQCVETRSSYAREKLFFVPDGVLADENTLAVKAYTTFGSAGLASAPVRLEAASYSAFYHPDYDYDDNLYRWLPW